MRVLITGVAGFVGSRLAKRRLQEGAETVVLDDFRTGRRENLRDCQGVELIEGSVVDRNAVARAMKGVDFVHHLAAMVSVPESMAKPYECLTVNAGGTVNVLEAARNAGVKKVVLSSSAAVYGDDPTSPKTVDLKPAPKSPYAITKLDGEYYLNMYREEFGLPTVSLRYFNVYGPKQDPKSQYAAAIPIFVSRALRGESLTIFGDGEQTRDFVFVDDVVEANVLAAGGEATGVFNVATGEATTVNETVAAIKERTGSGSEIVYAKEREGDVKHSLASIEETTRALGFRPKTPFAEGLRQTIDYFVEYFEREER
ncbi:MAG: NAD-dependent epimerase/dehydratase family protein [Ignavibacteriales bacterium]|nr:NAD-dependent epimerase/dehydratase family protein [Ignavibacteriales bacterium]